MTSNIQINGKTIPFKPGETIYEAARRSEIEIPTLCYDPRLAPFGACRLCVVEIEGVRSTPASCTTLATDGMVVRTATPEIEGLRHTLLEMVVSENPQLEVDPLRGYASQELTDLAARYGVEPGRFVGAHSGHSRPDDGNPFLLRDYDLCISCYRCVRVCAEQEGDYAISVANRGFATRIVAEFDNPLEESACTFCGQCVQTCPTGALADRKAMRFANGG